MELAPAGFILFPQDDKKHMSSAFIALKCLKITTGHALNLLSLYKTSSVNSSFVHGTVSHFFSNLAPSSKHMLQGSLTIPSDCPGATRPGDVGHLPPFFKKFHFCLRAVSFSKVTSHH